jgi:hypothetical protein
MANPNNSSKGFVDLQKIASIEMEEKKPNDPKFIFHLHLPERDYVLAANNEEDRQFWYDFFH